MIADALFSPALQKILSLLFVRVNETFYLNEIIRMTGLGSASVQRELKRLDDAGLVVSQRIGNLRRFRANEDSPVYPELHALIQKTFGLTGVLYAALAPLLPALRVAFIYGSVAKGSETAASDIDLLLVGDALAYGTLLSALAPAEEILGRKINPTPYSVADYIKRVQEQQHFLIRVLEQSKMFLMGDEDDLRRLGEPAQAQGGTH
jgi:predicted nucleotidyltransferase